LDHILGRCTFLAKQQLVERRPVVGRELERAVLPLHPVEQRGLVVARARVLRRHLRERLLVQPFVGLLDLPPQRAAELGHGHLAPADTPQLQARREVRGLRRGDRRAIPANLLNVLNSLIPAIRGRRGSG
jgi:hypothetical protein